MSSANALLGKEAGLLRLAVAVVLLLTIGVADASPAVGAAGSKIIRVALHKGTTMKAGLQGQPVTSYYARVDIGTPPRPFNLSIDIGAHETWLPHYSMLGGILYHRLHYKRGYSKKKSSTSVKENIVFTFEHMQCELEAKPYEDLFEFRDVIESFKRPIIRQRFLSVSSASNDRFSDLPSDGVLAFNGQPASQSGTQLLLLNLLRAKLIEQPVFSLWLDANPDTIDGGELTLGGLNPTRYMGVMIRHKVVGGSSSSDRWALGLREVLLGDTVVSCYRSDCSATLATGVNDLFGPREDVQRIIDALRSINGGIRIEQSSGNSDLYEIDCLQVVNLPPLRFVINDVPYVVPPVDYLRKKVDGVFFKSSTCYIAILPSDSAKNWVLGSNFLANYYTVFDFNKREVCRELLRDPITLKPGATICHSCQPDRGPADIQHEPVDRSINGLLEIIGQFEHQVKRHIKQSLNCPICLSQMNDAVIIRCRHSFCGQCLIQVCREGRGLLCPICRAPFKIIFRNHLFEGLSRCLKLEHHWPTSRESSRSEYVTSPDASPDYSPRSPPEQPSTSSESQ